MTPLGALLLSIISVMPLEEARARTRAALAAEIQRSPELGGYIDHQFTDPSDLLAVVADCVMTAWPDTAAARAAPDRIKAIVSRPGLDPFARGNLALHVARRYVSEQRLEEALAILEPFPEETMVDPATFHFVRAVAQHGLHQSDAALISLMALEKTDHLPARYAATARAMKEQIAHLKREELGGIAFDMRDLRRRFQIGAADKKSLALTDDVIARLDKLIKEIEDQQGQGGGEGSSSGGSNQSPGPGAKGTPNGGGPGKTDEKTFRDRSPWGRLPDKQRDQALQELGRDFPGHYRDVIEQYFRRLATSEARRSP